MTQSYSQNSRSISLLDSQEFLNYDASRGRMDKSFDGDVTLSVIPDESGETRWEARTADGKTLRLFHLTIESAATAFDPPIVIDTTDGVYVCYEDEARQQSWCIKVRTN